MKFFPVPLLDGVVKGLHPRLLEANKCSDVMNVIFDNGKVSRRTGYTQIGESTLPLNGPICGIGFLLRLLDYSGGLVASTSIDHYNYDLPSGEWNIITPIYTTGTVDVNNGSTSVSGTTTNWPYTTWPDDQYYIKFETTDPNAAGTWYLIAEFTSATGCTLDTAYSGSNLTGASYVIKKSHLMSDDMIVTFATPVFQADWEKTLIAVHHLEAPLKWTGSGQMTELGGSPPWGRYISEYSNYVAIANFFIGNDYYSQSVAFCNPGDPETGWANYIYGLYWDGYPITGLQSFKNKLFAFKQYSIYEFNATGNADAPFDITMTSNTIGCISGETIKSNNDIMMWLGRDGIYASNGIEITKIGDEVFPHILRTCRMDYLERSFATLVPERDLYVISIVSSDADEYNGVYYPDIHYVYNYRNKSWSIWTLADIMNASGTAINLGLAGISHQTLIDAGDTLESEDEAGIWTDIQLPIPSVALGDKDGYVYSFDLSSGQDDGEEIDAFFVTADLNLTGEPDQIPTDYAKKVLKIIITLEKETTSEHIIINASTDFGETWSADAEFDLGGAASADTIEIAFSPIRHGKQARVKMTNVDGADFSCESILIGYEEVGFTVRR